jgi:hypothetical protein
MEKEIKEKINKRLISNLELAEELVKRIKENPQQRFGQILINFKFIEIVNDIDNNTCIIKDPFYEESTDTLKRVKDGRNS